MIMIDDCSSSVSTTSSKGRSKFFGKLLKKKKSKSGESSIAPISEVGNDVASSAPSLAQSAVRAALCSNSPLRGGGRSAKSSLRPNQLEALSNHSSTSRRRRRGVRFDPSDVVIPAAIDEQGGVYFLNEKDVWWTNKELQYRKASDMKLLNQVKDAQRYMKECKRVRKDLQEEISSRQQQAEDGDSTGTASTRSSSFSSTEQADAAGKKRAEQEELFYCRRGLESLVTKEVLRGYAIGFRGMEGGGMSSRRERTKALVDAISACYKAQQQPKKKRGKSSTQLEEDNRDPVAALSLQMTRADQYWARALAIGDRKVVVHMERKAAAAAASSSAMDVEK